MTIALALVAAVLLSVAWLGNRNWGALVGSAGAGCAGLCVGVLGTVVAGAVFMYGYNLDPHFSTSPASELFWLALAIFGGSFVFGFGLFSADGGGLR